MVIRMLIERMTRAASTSHSRGHVPVGMSGRTSGILEGPQEEGTETLPLPLLPALTGPGTQPSPRGWGWGEGGGETREGGAKK